MSKKLSDESSLTLINFAAFVIIIAGIIAAKTIIAPFLMALFISIICAQPIFWLEKRRVPKGLSILIVLVGIITIFIGFGYLIGGSIASFSANAPAYETSLNSTTDSVMNALNSYGIKITREQFPALFDTSKILALTVKVFNEFVSMMGNTFLVFLTILFMLLELGSIPDKLKVVFKGTDGSIDYLRKIVESIRHYLGIKTLISVITSILIFIALSIIGLDYAILWAIIAGTLNYIPNIGSIIAAVPPLLFALVQLGPASAVWTLASFMAVNNILGNFIEPRIMGKGLGLSTLVVFLSLIFWGFVLGTVGMFLSVPLTITIKIILEQDEKTRWIAILLGPTGEAK
jgi:AI-2 transport protein TqsA